MNAQTFRRLSGHSLFYFDAAAKPSDLYEEVDTRVRMVRDLAEALATWTINVGSNGGNDIAAVANIVEHLNGEALAMLGALHPYLRDDAPHGVQAAWASLYGDPDTDPATGSGIPVERAKTKRVTPCHGVQAGQRAAEPAQNGFPGPNQAFDAADVPAPVSLFSGAAGRDSVFTVATLAKALGITRRTVQLWAKAQAWPSFKTATHRQRKHFVFSQLPDTVRAKIIQRKHLAFNQLSADAAAEFIELTMAQIGAGCEVRL